MNRFEDRVEQGFDRIADHASPSSTAWEAFQQRIADDADQSEVEIIMMQEGETLRANDRSPRRGNMAWMIGAAAAAVVVVIGLIVITRGNGEPSTVVDQPLESTPSSEAETSTDDVADEPAPGPTATPATSAPTVETTSPSTSPPATTSATQPPPIGGTTDDPASLPLTGMAMGPGWYRTTQLSHPPAHPNLVVEFAVDAPMTIFSQRTSALALVAGEAQDGPLPAGDLPALELVRLGSWSGSEDAVDATVGLASIASGDLDGWIEANDVEVQNRRTVTVDGIEAQVLDVVVGSTAATIDGLCAADTQPCIWMGSVEGASLSGTPETNREQRPHELLLQASTLNRVWVIPIEGFDPLIVRAVAPTAEPEWLDEIESTTVANLRILRDETG